MSAGGSQVSNPNFLTGTPSPQPSNSLFIENVSMLYTPSTPVKSYPMDIDGATLRKIEAMDPDEATIVTPSKTQSTSDSLINEGFLHATVSKILCVSFKPNQI